MRFYLFKRLPLGLRAGVSVSLYDLLWSSKRQAPVNYASFTKSLDATSLYVISNEAGHCKIGYSTDPELRLAALQIGSPLKMKLEYTFITTLPPRHLESEAHRLLLAHRLAGEWFDVTVDHAIETINQASANLGRPIGVMTDSVNMWSLAAKPQRDWAPLAFSLTGTALFLWFLISHQ